MRGRIARYPMGVQGRVRLGVAWALLGLAMPGCSTRSGVVDELPLEIMLGWRHAPERRTEMTLEWSDPDRLPAGASEDLRELREAFLACGSGAAAVIASPDGRSVARAALHGRSDPVPASGVLLWPDWRDAQSTVRFDDASQATFLSDRVLLLSQHPEGGPYRSWVIDVRDPTIRYAFHGYRLESLSVASSGAWAAITTEGDLHVGRLEPQDATGSVKGERIALGAGATTLLWRRGDRFLLVERGDRRIELLARDPWRVVASIAGTLGPVPGSATPIGEDGCFVSLPDGAATLTISASGEWSTTRWPFQRDGGSEVALSPTGRYLVSQRPRFPSTVERDCRPTPLAAAGASAPAWSPRLASPEPQFAAWLRWDPSTPR